MTEKLEMTRARASRLAIERLYIGMRHLFNRGYYKPRGESGKAIADALLTLSPEIYGSLEDQSKVDLAGLTYVVDRLPKGITECRNIKFISEEGYYASNFEPLIPFKRASNCYRIDNEQILIEVTRGKSEIYDYLTHLTYLFLEAKKIRGYAFNSRGEPTKDWLKLESVIKAEKPLGDDEKEIAFSYLSALLGSTFEETRVAHNRLKSHSHFNTGLFKIVYWLGKLDHDEEFSKRDREVSFSPTLRQRVGQHIYGEKWSNNIKLCLLKNKLTDRPVHLISANLHSVMNFLFALPALKGKINGASLLDAAKELARDKSADLRTAVEKHALSRGMILLKDQSGTNISVQIFDLSKIDLAKLPKELELDKAYIKSEKPVIILMDYAFGEQAYETMDELLKPLRTERDTYRMNLVSISIMGKAGILAGSKGDIMIPTSHVFEGTADNYPLNNDLTKEDFEGRGLKVFKGPMITVLGTSLQNQDVLSYFKDSSWAAVGLEMEGAHYQKAIQSQAMIRGNIRDTVKLRYAYYASDNPLKSGSTLAAGPLGRTGIKPTYLITKCILNRIMTSSTD